MQSRIDIIITDFDGVVLDSESAKFDGFSDCFSIFPEDFQRIMAYLRSREHLNRYQKFRCIFESLLGRTYTVETERWITDRCNACVYQRVMASPEVPGARIFFQMGSSIVPVCVVSGTPIDQLARVVEDRGLAPLFHELHGIPPQKRLILADILKRHRAEPQHAVYIGDRNSDLIAARENRIPFIAIGDEDTFEKPYLHCCTDFYEIGSLFDFDAEQKLVFLST